MRNVFLAASLLFASLYAAEPGIGQNGVFNAASCIPPTLPGGALAPGALFSLDGVRFDPRATAVVMIHGTSRISVPIASVQSTRIEARIPTDVPLGPASLTVTSGGESSKPFPIFIAPSNPGLFSRNGLGWGPARTAGSDSLATPGQRLLLFATGLGSAKSVRVHVGSQSVRAEEVGTGPIPGEEKITIRVPQDVPSGCHVPVYIDLPSERASNVVTVAVRDRSGHCDVGPVPTLAPGPTTVAVLSRASIRNEHSSMVVKEDHALIVFAQISSHRVLAPVLLLPPPGTCTSYTSSFQSSDVQLYDVTATLIASLGDEGLNAGPHLTLSRAGQERRIPRVPGAPGLYKIMLGSSESLAGRRVPGLFLDPGDLLLAGAGGKDVPAFAAQLKAPMPLEWLDREQHAEVDRAKPLTVQWEDSGANRQIVILATNVDQITTASGMCLCVALESARRFTVPQALLANIPATKDLPGNPYDRLLLAALSQASGTLPFGGTYMTLYASGRFVKYR